MTEQEQQQLKFIEPFGFKYFGKDESGELLVIAPKGQVVKISLAIGFAQEQIKKQQAAASSGGPESIPNMPVMVNTPEANLEQSAETNIEKAEKSEKDGSNPVVKVTQNEPPKVAEKPKQASSPYGDGFQVPFDPNEVDKTISYINKNAQKSLNTPARWLAKQFEKYLASISK